MHWLALGIALLVALGIIAIGTQYVASPRTATRSFGLPLPEAGANVAWWLRLKGVRDIASGLAVLAFMAWGGPRDVGIVLLALAIIPVQAGLAGLLRGRLSRSPATAAAFRRWSVHW